MFSFQGHANSNKRCLDREENRKELLRRRGMHAGWATPDIADSPM